MINCNFSFFKFKINLKAKSYTKNARADFLSQSTPASLPSLSIVMRVLKDCIILLLLLPLLLLIIIIIKNNLLLRLFASMQVTVV